MSVKQVILMRRDLKMRRGKEIAQGAHASMKVLLDKLIIKHAGFGGDRSHLMGEIGSEITEWIKGSFTKICLKVNSEEELLRLVEQAKQAGLHTAVIVDAGRTEFKGIPTITCAAIGPAKSEEIDKITGRLELL